MSRYFLRSTVHANMNQGHENPQHLQEPQENNPHENANNEPNIETSDLLRELQIIYLMNFNPKVLLSFKISQPRQTLTYASRLLV